jgi:predicted amidohydrolase
MNVVADKPEKIFDIYHRIFSKDPLLIDLQSQTDYRDALLKHLLLSRSMSTGRNRRVDLQLVQDRKLFLKRTTPRPRRPAEDLKQRYDDTRRERTEVPKADFDELKKITMVARGDLTTDRNGTKFAEHGTAETSLRDNNARSMIENRLRIATIGYRVKISRVPKKAYFDEELAALAEPDDAAIEGLPEESGISELGRTELVGNLARWQRKIVSYLRQAYARKPHLIMLPEFCLPPLGEKNKGSKLPRSLKKLCHCDGGDHFLFAGSRHEGPYNRGLILTKAGANTCGKWWHYKSASARSLGENVLARFARKAPTYVMSLTLAGRKVSLAIMVAICYDAFDPSTFLNLVLQSRQMSEGIFSVILVPSFNTSEEFVALLRDLSFLARCVVVYVNGLHGNATVYAYGVAMADVVEHRQVIQEKINTTLDELTTQMQVDNERVLRAPERQEPAMHVPEYQDWKVRTGALRTLKSNLRDLEESGALDHVITIERVRPERVDDDYAPDDILYYNLDIAMLQALADFRSQYFLNDRFLPAAFHEVAIEETIRRLKLDIEEDA